MENKADKPDPVEQANAVFWNPPTLDAVMAQGRPMVSWDDLDIPDLTDEEREAFASALDS